jgi:hypothetical protein
VTNRNIVFVGAALLVVGLFTPIVTMPMIGAVNLFGNGGNITGLILMALAALAAGLALKDRTADGFWPGAAAVGILIYCFGRLQYGMAQMRASLKALEGNPFAGIAEGAMGAVQIQWGWLVLAAGAGLVVYGALKDRNTTPLKLFAFPDNTGRVVAALSLAALLALPAMDLIGAAKTPARSEAETSDPGAPVASTTDDEATPTRAEAAYIADHLQVYELEAKYFNSVLDGRVPGVTFKVKNNGPRTLNKVVVRVVFYDAAGQPIAEEEYTPVLVSSYNFGDSNTPLRPNYISQQDRGSFYTAKSVPTEWQTGRATATITDIEFGPDE